MLESKEAKDYLEQLAKELHAPVKHKFPTRRIFASKPNEIWAVDLADMSTWKDENKGYTYILMIFDVFTRWATARALKTKTNQTKPHEHARSQNRQDPQDAIRHALRRRSGVHNSQPGAIRARAALRSAPPSQRRNPR